MGIVLKEEQLLAYLSFMISSKLRHHCTPISLFFYAIFAKAPAQVGKDNTFLGILSINGQYLFWQRSVPLAYRAFLCNNRVLYIPKPSFFK